MKKLFKRRVTWFVICAVVFTVSFFIPSHFTLIPMGVSGFFTLIFIAEYAGEATDEEEEEYEKENQAK